MGNDTKDYCAMINLFAIHTCTCNKINIKINIETYVKRQDIVSFLNGFTDKFTHTRNTKQQ